MTQVGLAAEIIVVDTDVFSFIWKKDGRARQYLQRLHGCLAAVSFQTVGELYKGAYKIRYGQRKMRSLEAELRRYYNVPYNHRIAQLWGELSAERERMGKRMEPPDAWIAATARWLDVPVMTHNRRHFEGTPGLTVISYAP